MERKAMIVILLLDESFGRTGEEIQKEILRELSSGIVKIPWCRRIEKVSVT